jgi:hypothetical protein
MFPTNALTSESIALPCYVLSIPQNVYGEKVKEHSLEIYNSVSPISYIDDGQSRLIVSGTDIQVGYVSYAFGIAVIQRSTNINSPPLLASSASYFAAKYFPQKYFGTYFQAVDSASVTPSGFMLNQNNPLVSSASYYAAEYFPQNYFGAYFQAVDSASVISPPSASIIALNFDGMFLTTGSSINIAFNSKHTIYEKTAVCSIEPQEFNFSSNQSLASSTLSGSIIGSNFIPATGSTAGRLMLDGVLPPYMTTVGLYNDAQELLAIAKFPRPLQRSVDTQQSIIVRFDI